MIKVKELPGYVHAFREFNVQIEEAVPDWFYKFLTSAFSTGNAADEEHSETETRDFKTALRSFIRGDMREAIELFEALKEANPVSRVYLSSAHEFSGNRHAAINALGEWLFENFDGIIERSAILGATIAAAMLHIKESTPDFFNSHKKTTTAAEINFSFEDILEIDVKTLSWSLIFCDRETIAFALKNVDKKIVDKILDPDVTGRTLGGTIELIRQDLEERSDITEEQIADARNRIIKVVNREYYFDHIDKGPREISLHRKRPLLP